MITGANFIGSTESKEGNQFLIAYNPADQTTFPEQFHVAGKEEIEAATQLSADAFTRLKSIDAPLRARFLETIADEIMALGDELVKRACEESGLPEGRIVGERGRTCNQLKAFATFINEGSWVNATIDTAQPDRAPVPKPDLRKMQAPIGPVVVFGASNFPLAFSTAGGDTASALAAGNPVIVKGHESHLGTNELISRAILKAARDCNLPEGVFSMLNGGPEVGQALVKDPNVKAVGFTGSLNAGKALTKTANERLTPIPVYAEMGSTNPIVLLPERLSENSQTLAEQIASSVTLGVGQFCTNPGLLIAMKSKDLEDFSTHLSNALQKATPGVMLNAGISKHYRQNRAAKVSNEGVTATFEVGTEVDNLARPLLAKVSSSDFMFKPHLHEEVFGPFTLLVECENELDLLGVISVLEGQLTGTVMATESDLRNHQFIVENLKDRVGRILFNGVPTGVEVCSAMHHGGPFPATSDAKFTSVGTDAIYRFTRPICYQNWPQAGLPEALKDENPLGIWRLIDGERTRAGS